MENLCIYQFQDTYLSRAHVQHGRKGRHTSRTALGVRVSGEEASDWPLSDLSRGWRRSVRDRDALRGPQEPHEGRRLQTEFLIHRRRKSVRYCGSSSVEEPVINSDVKLYAIPR